MPSNLAATVVQDIVVNYNARMDRNEQRPSAYHALRLFKEQSSDPNGILDPAISAAIQRTFNTSVKVPVVNYKDVSIGNVRTCALKTDGLTSAVITLTAVTYAFGFITYPQQHFENYLSYQSTVGKLMEAGLQKLAATMDAACVNVLETNKNAYWPQSVLDYYAQTGDALQVPQVDKNDFFNQVSSIMATMDFPENLDVVLNPIGMATVRRLANQGEGNSTNQSFQLLGYNWYPTNRVTNGDTDIEATVYLVAPGSVALESRVDPDARNRERIHESKYWDIFPNAPYVGLDLGLFYQADCADASAVQAATLANFTRTKIESWELSVDVFYMKAYNSSPSTRFSPIVKAEILN